MPIKRDEFLSKAADIIDDHFPKGVAKERGEAMVMLAMLLNYLMDEGAVEKKEA